ncbi:SseB family protein [Ectobacillus sp. JY-23]|uniref:SseB family protein n=1 Tax=Ectobacillus sp. JY-23 TaxID=2933872 RepID=UPI001FF4E789|nr:SseB family protein [Ectobacillus sp. JY-23]UOY92675.1 SseB family protein [Ectobacillus sp. JY-23]
MTEFPAITKVETLLVMAKANEKRRKDFYEALLESHLYTFGTLEAEEEATTGQVTLRYFQGDGRWVLPIFTRLDYMREAMPEDVLKDASAIMIRGKELFDIVDTKATVVLNVGSEVDKSFTEAEIEDIKTGKIFTYYK